MDIEGTLISRIITTGEIEELISREVQSEHFADEDLSDVYEYLCDFYREHKTTPTMDVVRYEFPDYKPILSKNPVAYHVEKFVNFVRERTAIDLVRGYHDALEDPRAIPEIEVYAMEMAKELAEVLPVTKIERLSDTRRRDDYYLRKRKGFEQGVLLGIPTFDDITYGAQPYELLIFGGRAGAGKSTMLVYAAVSAYLRDKTALVVTMENTAEQTIRKIDVMLAQDQIRYSALKSLAMNKEEEEAWDKVLERVASERHKHDIYVQGKIGNVSVEKIQAEQFRYKPDVVIVDYLELMRPRKGIVGWEAVKENGQGLKQNARTTQTPYFAATQLSRQSGETSYQSVEQIADILITIRGDQEDDQDGEMELTMRKYRDGPSRAKARMIRKLDTMDIHEKDFAERFPMKENKALMGRQQKLEKELELATIIGGRPNPWTKRRNGH